MARVKKRADARYVKQVYLGLDENGKRRYKSVYGATLKEAEQKADDLRLALNKGIDINARQDTFETWKDMWLESKTCGEGQLTSYKACVKKLSALYPCEIGKIRTADIQLIVNNVARAGLSRKTITQIRMAARQIFQLAIVNRVLDYNPAEAVVIPSSAKPKAKREALTDEQIRWIRETPHRAQTAAMIMLYCGLRRGELLALRWSDIDLTKKELHVRRTVEMINGKPVEKLGGKSHAATRDITIPDILVVYLKEKQPTITERRKELYPLVCEKASGGYHSAKSWEELWSSYMEELNIKYGDFSDCGIDYDPKSKLDPRGVPCVIETFSAHRLRHTYATLLYESGVDVMTSQKLLGHASPNTTLGIYTHLRESHRTEEMKKLNTYLNGDTSQIQVKKSI